MRCWKTLLSIMWVLQAITRHEKIHWSLYYLRSGHGQKMYHIDWCTDHIGGWICCFWAPLLSPKEDVLCNKGAWISAIQSQSYLLSVSLRYDSGNRRPWSSYSILKDCQCSYFHWVLVCIEKSQGQSNNQQFTSYSMFIVTDQWCYFIPLRQYGYSNMNKYRSSQDQIRSY